MKLSAKKIKKKWEDKRHKLEQHTDKWIEELEKIFNFATYARYWFADGGLEERRIILGALGLNLKLKDKKIRFKGLNPIFVLQGMKKTKDYESVLFELLEKPEVTVKNTSPFSAFPSLLKTVDKVRTYFLLDKLTMINPIPDKMEAIS